MFLAVYGSLRRGQPAESFLSNPSFRYIGTDHVKGTLMPVGPWYPGLLLWGGTDVVVDLYEVLDPEGLRPIHNYEGYDPDNPEESLFVLAPTNLVSDPTVEVMTYEYNQYTIYGAATAIEHGDWARYVADSVSERNTNQAA